MSVIINPKMGGLRGFAMIEVLVTMVIMAVGMLGIASMLLLSHKASSSSYLKQQAMQTTYNIIDRMRANRQAAIDGSYNVNNLASGVPTLPSTPSPDCSSAACTPTQLATYDVWYWLARDVSLLPNGSASITTSVNGGNTIVTVTLQWDDSPAQSKLGAAGDVSAMNASLVRYSIGTSL